jgi:DNA recombination protein RmuC
MDFSLLTLVLSLFTLGVVIFIFLRLRDQNQKDSGQTEILENKIDSVSKDLNDIENQLASVTTPINELNRFLGGNVTTGRLGEWSLESIVKEILPDGSYAFQENINPENQDRVDCAVKTADGITIPIDSKFYAGQYKQYQEAGQANLRANVLRDLRTAILRDADDIASKYLRQNSTTNYAVLYIASEKLIDLVDEIENLRQDCLSEKKVLIQGPNTLAAFLDTIRIGHHYLQLNETAAKVAEVVRRIKSQFDSFDKSTDGVLKRLDASVKEVTALQTRINVLGRELNKGTEELKDE